MRDSFQLANLNPFRTIFIVGIILLFHLWSFSQTTQPTAPNEQSEATKIFSEAQELYNQKTSESLTAALKKFRLAVDLFAHEGDKRGQAESWIYVGMVEDKLGGAAEAIKAYEYAVPLSRDIDFKFGEAIALGHLGTIHSKSRQFQKAIEYGEKAAVLFQAVGKKELEATTRDFIALAYQALGKKEKAIEAFLDVLILFHDLGNEKSEAMTLNSLGNIYGNSGDQQKAKECFEKAIPISQKIADKSIEAFAVSNLAVVNQALGNKKTALENYSRAQLLFHDLCDRKQEAMALNYAGLILLDQGDRQKARDAFDQSLKIAEAIGEKVQEGVSVFNIGGIYERTGDYRQAITYYDRALTFFREGGANAEEATALGSIGFDYANLGERDKAVEYYNQALILHRQIGNRLGEAATLNNIGSAYGEMGQLPKALEYHQMALEIFRSAGDRTSEANVLLTIGQSLDKVGDRTGALERYSMALPIYRELLDKKGEAQVLAQIALIYQIRGEVKKAEDLYKESLVICRATGDKDGEAAILMALGLFLNTTSNFAKALENFKRASDLCGDKMCVASTQIGAGLAYQGLADYQKAIESFNSAISISHEIRFSEGEIFGRNTLGQVFAYLGLNQRAMDSFQEALKISQTSGGKDLEAVSLGNIGLAYFNLEDYERAVEYHNRALSIAQKTGNKNSEMTALNNAGLTLVEMKKPKEAIEYFQKSLIISKMLGNNSAHGIALLNLGYAYGEIGDSKSALANLNEAFLLSKILDDSNLEAFALGTIGLVWYEQKNLRFAAFYGKQALNIIQSLRTALRGFDQETQKAFIKRFEKSYRKLADIFVEMGRIAEAEQVLSMLKEEEYFDYLRRDDKTADELKAKMALTPDEQKAFDEYKKYADNLTALGKEYGELQAESKRYEVGQFPKQKRLDQLEKLIANANKVFTAFIDDLKNKFAANGANPTNDMRVAVVESGTQTMLKELGQPRTIMVSTIASEDRLNLIVTTSDVQRAHTVDIKAANLNKLVSQFRADVKNPRVDPRVTGKKLFDTLFPASLQKDLESIKADTIVWSLDGTLRYVPIAALWDGKQYLVEKYKNVLITLASRNRLGNASPDRAKWQALGVGVSKQATLKEPDGTSRNFEALTSVPEELCGVVADPDNKKRCSTLNDGKNGVVNGKSLLDEQFTLQTFKNSLGRYPIVHIASHFSLNVGNENDSFLLVGGGDERKLTLADVRQGGAKFLGVELLTLSACNTAMGTGNRSNGVEVEGFGALAQNQGAKSVLASLWPVADTSTRDLMIEFYKQLEAASRVSKAEALQKAQVSLLNGKYPHPYYWSPFILMGNWQ